MKIAKILPPTVSGGKPMPTVEINTTVVKRESRKLRSSNSVKPTVPAIAITRRIPVKASIFLGEVKGCHGIGSPSLLYAREVFNESPCREHCAIKTES